MLDDKNVRPGSVGVQKGILHSLYVIPLLFVGAAISLPVGLLMNSRWRKKEREFSTTMEENHRMITWTEFVHEVDQNRGTTIIERLSMKGRTRWWWTPRDIYAESPHPVEDSSSLFPDPVFFPFHVWCGKKYLNAASGQAKLVSCSHKQRQSFKVNLSGRRAVTVWAPQTVKD